MIKFENRDKLSMRDKNDIRVKIKRHVQIFENVLYVLKIDINLLFIIILNCHEFLINFDNQSVKIIDKRINKIVIRKRARKDLYELTIYILNKIFLL